LKTKKIKVIFTVIGALAIILTAATACTNPLDAEPVEQNESPLEFGVLIEKFAERFGLDEDEVYEFVEQLRQGREIKAEEKLKQRLDELVSDGKITVKQKDAILQKLEELKTFREELEDMKVSEARKAIREKKQELKDWAEENDIDLKGFFFKNGPWSAGARMKRHFRLFLCR